MDAKTIVFAESRCGLAVTLVGTAGFKIGARRAIFSDGVVVMASELVSCVSNTTRS